MVFDFSEGKGSPSSLPRSVRLHALWRKLIRYTLSRSIGLRNCANKNTARRKYAESLVQDVFWTFLVFCRKRLRYLIYLIKIVAVEIVRGRFTNSVSS